jgi:hypothetical protein
MFPQIVDSSQQFMLYKQHQDNDITSFFLDQYTPQKLSYKEHINFTDQFTDYAKLNFDVLNPIISQYFSPSNFVTSKVLYFENKYNIQYNNLCSVFYRGNDKALECKLATHDDFIKRAKIVKSLNENIRFLHEYMEKKFIVAIKSNRLVACQEEGKKSQYQNLSSLNLKDGKIRIVSVKGCSFSAF